MTRSRFTASRFVMHIGIAAAALALAIVISPGVGSGEMGVFEAWRSRADTDSAAHFIAFRLRLPQTIKALVAGLTLALSGAVFQTLFRNVLATPYTLGIASGGSLGALIAVKLGLDGLMLGLPQGAWCAMAGCALVVGLVFLMAGGHRLTGNALVLGGVTIGFFCSAMMMFVTYLADVRETYFVVRWMMGSLESVGNEQVLRALGPLAVSWGILLWCSQSLNQFALGDEIAASRGVRPAALQAVCIIFASLGTACVVSLCGPIGFVGLIVPQAVRMVVGRDHRILLPGAALWGATFLVVCDWLTRLVPTWYGAAMGVEVTASPLPIGVMTAVVGAPVFLVLLRRGRSI